jgi:hypothetical protein
MLAFCQDLLAQKSSAVMPVPGLDPGIVAGIHALLWWSEEGVDGRGIQFYGFAAARRWPGHDDAL